MTARQSLRLEVLHAMWLDRWFRIGAIDGLFPSSPGARSAPRRNTGGHREIWEVFRFQPEHGGILVGVGILVWLGRTPRIETGRTTEHGPDSRDGRCAQHLDGGRTTA